MTELRAALEAGPGTASSGPSTLVAVTHRSSSTEAPNNVRWSFGDAVLAPRWPIS
jgi:hypothetical protein